jgi:cysteine synthase A
MTIHNDVVEAIGNTPLIKLNSASEATGCTILGKAEFMNPGGSVKDRAGRQMILEAEKRGELRPGGLVVEATAGNTGIGLAVVASARGYRTLIVIPDTQSQEKKDMLRLCGAELVEVPALPYANPNNYQHVGKRLADQLRKSEPNGVLFADQWNNLDNAKAHYESTGPEIWQQTDGKVDGFICSVGTGGTLAGISSFLKEKKKDIVIGCADPRGAAMYELFKHGEAKSTPGGSITEGIGLGRVTPVIKQARVDDAYLIPDEEAVPVIYDLLARACASAAHRHHRRRAIRLARSSTRQDHRDHPVRSETAISRNCSIRVHALEEPAGAGMAEAQQDRRASRSMTRRRDWSAVGSPTAAATTWRRCQNPACRTRFRPPARSVPPSPTRHPSSRRSAASSARRPARCPAAAASAQCCSAPTCSCCPAQRPRRNLDRDQLVDDQDRDPRRDHADGSQPMSLIRIACSVKLAHTNAM